MTTILTTPPAPGTPEWTACVSASKVPAMIRDADGNWAGLGYLTAYQQYKQIKGEYEEQHSDFMLKKFDKAHKMEAVAAKWWTTQQHTPEQWQLSDGEVTFANPNLGTDNYPVIATIDFVATNTTTGEQVGLECKNPDNAGLRPNWVIQTHAQKITAQLDRHELVVYPDNGEPQIAPADNPALDAKVADDIAHFIHLLEADQAPDPDDYAIDADTIAAIDQAKRDIEEAQQRLEALKQDVEQRMGNHKRAVYGDTVIATRTAGRFAQSRLPKDMQDIAKEDRFKKTSTKFDADAFKKEYPDAYAAATGDDIISFR